jgi:hypothetical protein
MDCRLIGYYSNIYPHFTFDPKAGTNIYHLPNSSERWIIYALISFQFSSTFFQFALLLLLLFVSTAIDHRCMKTSIRRLSVSSFFLSTAHVARSSSIIATSSFHSRFFLFFQLPNAMLIKPFSVEWVAEEEKEELECFQTSLSCLINIRRKSDSRAGRCKLEGKWSSWVRKNQNFASITIIPSQ